MKKRVPPSEQTRQAIEELPAKGRSEGNPLSEQVRLAVRQIVEEALEGKVRDLLGRGDYDHQDKAGGYRNGYRPGRLQTGEEEIGYASPQVRGRDSTELGELRQTFRGRSEALESRPLRCAPGDARPATWPRSSVCRQRRVIRTALWLAPAGLVASRLPRYPRNISEVKSDLHQSRIEQV